MEILRKQSVQWALGALFAAAIVYYALSPAPVPVDVAQIRTGSLEVTVQDEGVSRVKEVYTVSAPVAGRMLRPPLELGDTVKKDETIVASLHPSEPSFLDERALKTAVARVQAAEAALKFAKASVAKVEAELRFSRSDLERAQKLVQNKTVSERTFDLAKMNVDTLIAALETARAEVDVKVQELDSARAQLIGPSQTNNPHTSASCCIKVRAPESGRVLKIHAESETVVSAGAPILDVGNPKDLEIVVNLHSRDAVRIKEDAIAYVEDWGGEKVLKARVRRIESAGFMKVSALGIEEQRVKVRLDLLEAPDDTVRLGHDYRVFVRIVVWRQDGIVKIPLGALFRHEGAWASFVIENATAKLRKLKIGRRNQQYAEIQAGLKAGDRVIEHPSDRVTDGSVIVERRLLK